MRKAILIALFAGIAGCAGTSGEVGVSYGYTSPNLVYLDNGVQVVADYDYPVFYSDNVYWMYRGGAWYRSPYWNRGWVATYDVPTRIRRIDRPYAYAHYRGTRHYNGTYYGSRGGVEVRDHRTYRPQPQYRTEVRPQPQYRTQVRPQPQRTYEARPQYRTPTHTTPAPRAHENHTRSDEHHRDHRR